jgi:DNA-directed RNA polymerase specialized sigma24 family protein
MRHEITEPVTRDPYPFFLRLVDSEPERAAACFHEFVWKLLLSSPPPRFRGLTRQDQEDIIGDLVYRWIEDDFRVLRNYRDTGRPFAGYVAVAANNRAADKLRRLQGEKRRTGSSGEADGDAAALLHELPDPGPDPGAVVENAEIVAMVSSCLGTLSERCQLLLHGAGDGLKPRELVVLLGWPAEWNKKAHDALRECRKSLQRCLEKQHGLAPERV